MWHFISALCEIYQPLLDKLARNSIWTFEIQIKLSSSGFGCGHGSLMYCFVHVWNIVSICFYQIRYSYLTYFFLFFLDESIPTLSLKPAVNVAITKSVSYQSAMMWGQVGNFIQCISDDTPINCDKSANNPVHIQTDLSTASFLFSRNITRMQTAGT